MDEGVTMLACTWNCNRMAIDCNEFGMKAEVLCGEFMTLMEKFYEI